MDAADELQNSILSSFLEITFSQSVETARQFLDATNWKLDEAIQLFFIRGSENPCPMSSSSSDFRNPPLMSNHQSNSNGFLEDEDQVRAPLPVRREALYGGGSDEQYQDEMEDQIWEESDSLDWMYPPPIDLMYKGSFEKAKQVASMEGKWLLVNLQSIKEFNSHMLNRDTWSNEGVAQILKKNFIFWQVSDDTTEGRKISTYYNLLGSIPPVVLLLDPITGQKMCSWNGMIEGERLMEELVPFMDAGIRSKHRHPHHRHQQQPRESTVQGSTVNEENEEMMLALTASMETLTNDDPVCPSSTDTEMDEEPSQETCLMEEKKRITYPTLPEEPKTVDRKLVCRVGFRLPRDGRRVQRCFLRRDPIQFLWSFISSQLEADSNRPFRLSVPQGIPGAASKALDYESKLSFEESVLSNSMVLVTWDD